MKTTYYAIATTLVALLTGSVTAQKPKPAASLELKLAAEDMSYRMEGNLRISQKTGKPLAIYREAYRVNASSNAETQAREYLNAKRNLLGLSIADIQSLKLHAIQQNEGGYVVRLRQTWKGLAVNRNAEITIHITPANVVDFVQNGFEYGINLADITPSVSVTASRQQIMNRLQITGPVRDEKSSLMILHHQNTDYLVHRISFNCDEPVGDWEAYVDAKTGALLQVEDVALYHHAHKEKNDLLGPVKPLPAKTKFPYKIEATGTATIFLPDPLSTARATYGGSYRDNNDAIVPVLTAQLFPVTLQDITFSGGTYQLNGPYARVMDFEAPSKGLFSQASSNFSTNRNADVFEAVMCYYHVDAMMRHLNITLGLGIMPYQYTGGVRYDPSGLNGADNSHYLSSSGRFAMGEGGVDDAEDPDVIIHELGHGLHDWATVGGLSQVTGLSEGTGDYASATYSRTMGNWTPADPQYFWQYNWDGHNEFWAARELNFNGVYPGALVGEVHADGRIWAHANLRIADAIGRNRSDIVFWRGMMMTNSSTNQNDAANAVYQMAETLGYTNAERQAIHTSYVTAGYNMPAFVVLPVKLFSFNAVKKGSHAFITWKTSIEEGTELFRIERSSDGHNFTSIGVVEAAINSSTEKNYSFTDIAPLPGINFYRLQTKDIDGRTSNSEIVQLMFTKPLQLEIFPNPVQDMLVVKNVVNDGVIYVYDVSGKQVRMKKASQNNNGNVSINMQGLADGIYIVKLQTEAYTLESKIVKSKP